MLTTPKSAWSLLIIGAVFLSACGATPKATPTVDPGTQLTAIASTVQAQLTQAVALTPSAEPTMPPTPTPTEIKASPTVEMPVTTEAPKPTAKPTAKSASGDKARLIDQDPIDKTVMSPGEKFTVSWTFRNIGTTTWSTKYQLRFYTGTKMHLDPSRSVTSTNPPGGDTTISVPMKAPTKTGDYRSVWVITNADGVNFGSVYIAIKVQ
jgi:hypothetical protein